jgi:hypothetical protein
MGGGLSYLTTLEVVVVVAVVEEVIVVVAVVADLEVLI